VESFSSHSLSETIRSSDHPDSVPFLEARLHPVTTEGFRNLVMEKAKRGEETSGKKPAPFSITYLNAHCSNLAACNENYRDALVDFDLIYADGHGVVWASRLLGHPVPERVNAGDFIVGLCRQCSEKGVSLFLLGGEEGRAEAAAQSWREAAPGLRIVGVHHGFLNEEMEPAVAGQIRAARPDILLVGMSAPRQEIWARQWAGQLDVPVIWCVGALLEYYSGRPRAPVWVRGIGMEWLFRLLLEPSRLWRRYLLGNARFILRVLKARLTGR